MQDPQAGMQKPSQDVQNVVESQKVMRPLPAPLSATSIAVHTGCGVFRDIKIGLISVSDSFFNSEQQPTFTKYLAVFKTL